MPRTTLLVTTTAALLLYTLVCPAQDKAVVAPHDMTAAHEMMSGHPSRAAHDADGKPHRCMHKGMLGDGPMPHMVPLPSLPSGNAKLELQMQAEVLQKVGEILGKYAAQVKDAPATP